jgi:hypothetical protein
MNRDVIEEAGSSSEPCSDTYHGKSPNSEPEIKAQVDYVTALIESTGKPLSAFISYHSYSQLILLPWGWAADPKPDNFAELVNNRLFFFFFSFSCAAHIE